MSLKEYLENELEKTDLFLYMKNCLPDIYADFTGRQQEIPR